MRVGTVGSCAFFLEAAGLMFVEAGVSVSAVGEEGALNKYNNYIKSFNK